MLNTGILPHDWKVAKVIPIHKAGPNQLVENYRPISLTCTCYKLLEHIIASHINNYLNEQSTLTNSQHRFRKGFSTTSQLVETIHDFASSINYTSQIDAIFLGFTKAFNNVSHSKLLLKLSAILGNTKIINWMEGYLIGRKQCVNFFHASSSYAPVNSGEPQGSVLGPLLFLIFVNDIVTSITVKIWLFADDYILYDEIISTEDCTTLNSRMDTIINWCKTWQMELNPTKTLVLTITRKKKKTLTFTYTAVGQPISRILQHKYLGVTINHDLR